MTVAIEDEDPIERKIAEKLAAKARIDAEIARLRKDQRAAEAGGKIVLGGLVLTLAKNDSALLLRLADEAAKLARDNDRIRALALLRQVQSKDAAPSIAPPPSPVADGPAAYGSLAQGG